MDFSSIPPNVPPFQSQGSGNLQNSPTSQQQIQALIAENMINLMKLESDPANAAQRMNEISQNTTSITNLVNSYAHSPGNPQIQIYVSDITRNNGDISNFQNNCNTINSAISNGEAPPASAIQNAMSTMQTILALINSFPPNPY